MNTTLKPGQIVKHPEKGYGICVRGFGSQIDIWHGKTCLGCGATSCIHAPGDGWEPVEVIREGHVQVRVDDLNKNGLRRLGNRQEEPNTNTHAQWNAATRVGKAWAEQQAESHTEPATTTVSLPCPDCGETITETVRQSGVSGARFLTFDVRDGMHRCEPTEPVRLMHPEPTQRGAKATFTFHNGTVAQLLRIYDDEDDVWQDQDGFIYDWEQLTGMDGDDRQGSLTLGWVGEW